MSVQNPTAERTSELLESLAEIRARVHQAAISSSSSSSSTASSTGKDKGQKQPKLVAVSKYKPSSDILVCYEAGQIDFGENYVQELVDKAKELPLEIQWHFIGTLQSNKAKTLASIPNLHTIQTLTSTKAASALTKSLPSTRTTPLNVLIQINTSGEDSKSGLAPLSSTSAEDHELKALARHIITQCPNLHLQGLMTIGALELSLSATTEEKNADFERLKETREVLEGWLEREFPVVEEEGKAKWGVDGSDGEGRTRKLILSMGMSSDFEAAIKAGSDVVRVGTGVFGQRKLKEEVKAEAGGS